MHKAVGKDGYAGQFVSTQGCPEDRCKCVSTCVCVCVHLSPRGTSGFGCRSSAWCASRYGERGGALRCFRIEPAVGDQYSASQYCENNLNQLRAAARRCNVRTAWFGTTRSKRKHTRGKLDATLK